MHASDRNEGPVASSGSVLEEADIAVGERLGEHRHDPFIRTAGTLSEVADQGLALGISGGVLVVGLVAGKPRATEAAARILAAVLAATATKALLKNLVSRARPRVLIEDGRYAFEPHGPKGGEWQSFPSGHTADAVAAARALVRVFPEAWPVYAVAAAIGAVQVPRAKHYPADVVAGAVVGVVAEWATNSGVAALMRSIEGAVPNSRPRAGTMPFGSANEGYE